MLIISCFILNGYSQIHELSHAKKIQVGEEVEYLELADTFSIEQIKHLSNWQVNKCNSFKPKNVRNAIWLKLLIEYEEGQAYYITAETPNINVLQVYRQDSLIGRSGDEFAISDRHTPDAYATIKLEGYGQIDSLYVKLKIDEDFIIPLTLRSATEYQSSYSKRQLLMGLYMGVMGSILLYNFFLFISIRNRLLLYYCFYVLFVALTQISIFGDLSIYLYGEITFLLKYDLFIFSSLLGVSVAPFIIQLLDLRESHPSLKKIVLWFAIIYFLVLIISLTGWSMTGIVLSAINFSSATFLLFLGIKLARKNVIAQIFLLSWSMFLLGALAFILQNSGIIQYNNISQYTMVIGTALEAVLLSLALGYHFNRLIKENQTKAALILEQSELIENLDHKVITAELTNLRSQMNPHFLFNALTSIQNFILQNDKMKAVDYVAEYAKLVRGQLNQASSTHISIQREIENMDKYLRIEKLRTPTVFNYMVELDSKIDGHSTFIPPLFLQPLLENCVKHAFKNNSDTGIILIEFRLISEHNIVQVKVQDNGIGMQINKGTTHKSKGMNIIHERLIRLAKLYSNDLIGMESTSLVPHGFKAVIKLPIL